MFVSVHRLNRAGACRLFGSVADSPAAAEWGARMKPESLRGLQPNRAIAARRAGDCVLLGRSSSAQGHLLMLRAAWSTAGPRVRRQFLTDIVAELYRDERRPGTAHGSRDQARDDALAKFLAANVVKSSPDRVQASALLKRLNDWCCASGLPSWSSVRLSYAMKASGYVSEKSHFVWWIGIALTQPPPPAPPLAGRKGRKPSQK